MNTVDKDVKVMTETVETKRRPGRPSKSESQDKSTPLGDYIAKEAHKARTAKLRNPVVEKYYELNGKKLLLCKKMKSGTVHRTFIGSTDDKKTGPEINAFVKRVNEEGKLRVKV